VSGFEDFERYFTERTGKRPKKLQKYWVSRLLLGQSFAAVAPPGVGKTLFGLVFASWLAEKRGKRCYIVVPTLPLLQQCYQKLIDISKKNVKILAYLPTMKKSEKEDFRRRLANGDFDVLLTTNTFLTKNFDRMSHLTFDFIFVDDVDAVLKASKNVERILMLLGFTEEEIQKQKKVEAPRGQIVVSTATVKPGRKAVLFSKLLGFSVGSSRSALRNIDDFIVEIRDEKERLETLVKILKALGFGGLVYVPGESDAHRLASFLKDNGIPSAAITSTSGKKEIQKIICDFLKRNLQVLVGTATYYGLLVRGLDYPEHIYYAVFVSMPSFSVSLKDVENASPRMLLLLASIFRKDGSLKALIPYILSDPERREKARRRIMEIFEKKEFGLISEDVVLEDNRLIIPDISTYIQASGRTSRLLAGGVTKGLSIIIDTKDRLRAFRLRASYHDLTIKDGLAISELSEKKKELVKNRDELARIASERDVVLPAVFVVESPTKAKQISRFFGKPAVFSLNGHPFYEVASGNFVLLITASLGHVVDLVERGHYHGVIVKSGSFIPVFGSIKKCRRDGSQWVSGNYCPTCGMPADDDSAVRVSCIAQMAHAAGMLILATDPDTEGEKIAWDLSNLVGPGVEVKRAEFHEITKRAILRALSNLRKVDENRVKAQLVRRIEDRWIGFELSSILQRRFKDRNLSAGRAQTPVLTWIVHRFREYLQKTNYWLLKIGNIWVELGSEEELGKRLPASAICTVEIWETGSESFELTPPPPYSTDSVLRDLHRYLKISADQGMRLLQELFENGLITYHRTDSTRVSERGLQVAKQYLESDFVGRAWTGRETGPHECIRPTRPVDVNVLRDLIYRGVIQTSVPLTSKHFRVYDLIFRRFMASQAPNYRVVQAQYKIVVKPFGLEKEVKRTVSAKGRAFELFPWTIRIEAPLEPGTQRGVLVSVKRSKAELFTQADIISQMKTRGIGRPSTYSSLLSKLFARGYVYEKRARLRPTMLGISVERFLTRHFHQLISEERTRKVQQVMDEIEEGKKDYMGVLRDFYEELGPIRSQKTV
jgi:reverse gyrase